MIAIVYPQFYGVGGIARYIESFLANLPSDSTPVLLITSDAGMGSEKQFKGVQIIHIPATKGRFSLLIWSWRVRQLLIRLHATGRIKVVNFHIPPLIPGIFLPRNIPTVVTAHTTYLGMSGQFYKEHYFDSPWNAPSILIKKMMERIIFRKATAVITLTEQGRQEVEQYKFKGPLVEFPNGVDLELFKKDTGAPKDIDVLMVGRIEIRKGSRPMVEFCERLIERRPNVKICVVGYGDDEAYVNSSLMRHPNNVTLAGKVPFNQVQDYYNRSKLYVSTSYYEGLPGTCLEAMAMGLPVVTWDFLFYKGLVIPGRTGELARPNDFEELISKVERLCDSPQLQSAYGAEGRNLLYKRYAWKTLAAQVHSWIDSKARTPQ